MDFLIINMLRQLFNQSRKEIEIILKNLRKFLKSSMKLFKTFRNKI